MGCNETFLVTGAGGFIGGWLAETLCLAGNCEVRAGIRSWPGAVRLSRFPIHIVLCNVLDKEQLAQAMAGVTHVVHCAVGPGAVITEGTRNVLDASLQSGCAALRPPQYDGSIRLPKRGNRRVCSLSNSPAAPMVTPR